MAAIFSRPHFDKTYLRATKQWVYSHRIYCKFLYIFSQCLSSCCPIPRAWAKISPARMLTLPRSQSPPLRIKLGSLNKCFYSQIYKKLHICIMMVNSATPQHVCYMFLQLLPRDMLFLARHDDVIKWKHFPRYWPFVRGIHRSPVNFPHKGQWHGALVFSLIRPLNKRLS